jgi:hypothetical protein
MDQLAKRALPISVIAERIHDSIIRRNDQRYLLRDPEFLSIQTRNEQLVYLHDFILDNCLCLPWIGTLSMIFDITTGNVSAILCRHRNPKKSRGRPMSLTEEQEETIVDHILNELDQQHFYTKSELLRYAQQTYHPELSKGWLPNFLIRHRDRLAIATAAPQESPRLRIPRTYLNSYIQILHQVVDGIHPDLFYNLDEVGTSDWEDRKLKSVIVPFTLKGQVVHFDVDRTIRHQSIEVCISAAGDRLLPLFLSSDRSSREVFTTGVRENIDLSLRVADSAYMNEETFHSYISQYYIPYIAGMRSARNHPTETVVLLMDNLYSHCADRTLYDLGQNNILAISFPPHSSGLFQMLDLVVFGVMKGYIKTIQKNCRLSKAADHIYRSFKALELATCSTTIRSAFQRAGFEYLTANGRSLLHYEEAKVRIDPAFDEIWQRNFPEADLSPRQRSSRLGLLNAHFLKKPVPA